MKRFGSCSLGIAIAMAAGCGGPEVTTLDVGQSGWDTLKVSMRFEDSDWRGRRAHVLPGSVTYTVFSSVYDTLYAGPDSVIAIPDRLLGDSEPILVEACGRFGRDRVCEQKTVFASPKRVWSGLDVDYPTDPEYSRGGFHARPSVERRSFAGEEWEELPGVPVPRMTVHVRVAGTTGGEVGIPIRGSQGRFDLRSADGYRDFSYNLRSAFRDSGRAEVVFQAVAGEAGKETPAGSVRIALVDRSEEELLAGLQLLVRAAGNRIADRIGGLLGRGQTVVFIDDWSYDSRDRRYEAELAFWSRRSDHWQELAGRLDATEDGDRAVFHLRRAPPEAIVRWRALVGADSLSVGPLGDALREPFRGW